MASSKKPRKKHNMLKRNERVTAAMMKDVLVAWCNGNDANKMFTLSGKPRHYTVAEAKGLSNLALPWSIWIAVMCQDQQGQRYIQSEQVFASAPYPYQTMCEYLNERHQKLIASCNRLHVCCTGWVANPNNRELSDERGEQIMAELGAWDFSPQYLIDDPNAELIAA